MGRASGEVKGEGEGGEAGGDSLYMPRACGDGRGGEETRARGSINLYTPESLVSGVIGALEGAIREDGLRIGVDGTVGPWVCVVTLALVSMLVWDSTLSTIRWRRRKTYLDTALTLPALLTGCSTGGISALC